MNRRFPLLLQKVRTPGAALVASGILGWAAMITANDDWDDYFLLPRYSQDDDNSDNNNKPNERIVILGTGWGGLNALQKCAAAGNNGKDIVVVSPRPHFLYTPLLAGSAVGTITLRSACEPIRAILAEVSRKASKESSVTFVRADARWIDTVNRRVYATTGEPLVENRSAAQHPGPKKKKRRTPLSILEHAAREEAGDDTDATSTTTTTTSKIADADNLQLELSYDKLLIAVGAQPNTFGIRGVKENALFLKEAEDSAKLHSRLLSNLERASALMGIGALNNNEGNKYEAEINRLLTVVVVGGGPTGVELSAELADFKANDVQRLFGDEIARRLRIVLVEAIPRILGPFDASLAKVARQHLEDHGVEVRCGLAVTELKDPRSVTLAPSTPRSATEEEKRTARSKAYDMPVGALVWAAGIGPRPVVKKLVQSLGQTDPRGLKVDDCLRVEGTHGTVYAIGDAALSGNPPTAQVASQQGKHVGRMFRDNIDRPFRYYHVGSLCSLGKGNGIAQLVASNGNSALNIWDVIGNTSLSEKKNNDQRGLTGFAALAMWRSLYWSKLLSTSSRLSLSLDWLKAQFLGRDIIEPTLKRKDTAIVPKGGGPEVRVECFGTPLRRNPTISLVRQNTRPMFTSSSATAERP